MKKLNLERTSRVLVALFIFSSGLALLPFLDLQAAEITWRTFAGIYEPYLSVVEDKGFPGSIFEFNGGSYPPNSVATVWHNGLVLGQVNTNGSGELTFLIDSTGATFGDYFITATVNGNATATERIRLEDDEPVLPYPSGHPGPLFFLVGGETPTPTPVTPTATPVTPTATPVTPTPTATPTATPVTPTPIPSEAQFNANFNAGQSGSFFLMSGENFAPNETIAILAGNALRFAQTKRTLAVFQADANGQFTFILSSENVADGTYRLEADGTINHDWEDITIDADAPLIPIEGNGQIVGLAPRYYLPLIRR